ncbi:hypothetical protein N7467_006378 [Penicillium canescens]|nr:hypothetical protein N7467_006378 [Penicillium canescens]
MFCFLDRSRPCKLVLSIAAPRNARVNITLVARFYVVQYSSTVGTVISIRTVVSNMAALTDFTTNPGMFGAIVEQNNDGKFHVRYVSQAAFAVAVNSSQKTSR